MKRDEGRVHQHHVVIQHTGTEEHRRAEPEQQREAERSRSHHAAIEQDPEHQDDHQRRQRRHQEHGRHSGTRAESERQPRARRHGVKLPAVGVIGGAILGRRRSLTLKARLFVRFQLVQHRTEHQ